MIEWVGWGNLLAAASADIAAITIQQAVRAAIIETISKKELKGGKMSDGLFGTGVDPWQAILALIPGQQAGLGEQPLAGEGIGAALGQALAFLLPGEQAGLGEAYLPETIRRDVIKSWRANQANFYQLSNGTIAVRKKNGMWKVYRPPKHIVVSRNPRIGTLLQADKRINKLIQGLVTIRTRRSKRLFSIKKG